MTKVSSTQQYEKPIYGAFKQGTISFVDHCRRILASKTTIDQTSSVERQKGDEAFNDVLDRIKAASTASGVINDEEYRVLKEEIANLKDKDAQENASKEEIDKLNQAVLQAYLDAKLIHQVDLDDAKKREELYKKLHSQKESFDHRIQDHVDENANAHIYRILTMVMLGGALDALDILGNIFDSFGFGDFAQGVGDVVANEKVLGPFAEISRALRLDVVAEGLSRFPILNDVNQLALDLVGSDYLSPFASIADGALGSEGAKMAFSAVLLTNRFYQEVQLRDKFQNLEKDNEDYLLRLKEEFGEKIKKNQEQMADFIVGEKANNSLDACLVSAYLKRLYERGSTQDIPDAFKQVELKLKDNNGNDCTKNLHDFIEEARGKIGPYQQGEEEKIINKNLTEILSGLDLSGNNPDKEGYEAIKSQAKNWRGQDKFQNLDQKSQDKLQDEYKKLLEAMFKDYRGENGTPDRIAELQQIIDDKHNNKAQPNQQIRGDNIDGVINNILTKESPEKVIKELYQGMNKDKVLQKIKTELSPSTSPSQTSVEALAKVAFVRGT